MKKKMVLPKKPSKSKKNSNDDNGNAKNYFGEDYFPAPKDKKKVRREKK